MPGISKHDMIFMSYMCDLSLAGNVPKLRRLLNCINKNRLLENANAKRWDEISEISDIHEAVERFSGLVLELLDDHAPLRTIKQLKQNQRK